MQVAQRAIENDLAEQQRTTVAETGRPAAELMAGVGERDRLCTDWNPVAGEHVDAFAARQLGGVEAQRFGKLGVERQQRGRGDGLGLPRLAQLRKRGRETVLEV